MFLERPRVRFDGVYISKTTYIRQGEQSLDGFYRAWHQVEYYRYIRFFPDGHVMMLTTPEEPQSIVPRLRTRNTRTDAILLGHYRLSQDTDNQTKVFAVITKKKKKNHLTINTDIFVVSLYKKQIRVFMWGYSYVPVATRGSTNSSGYIILVI